VDLVFGGLSPSTTGDRSVTGQRAGDNFGYALGATGNVTGTSAADVLIGAPFHNESTASDAGRAYVYPGGSSATGAASLEVLVNEEIVPGTAPDDYFGMAVSSTVDSDGDGQPGFDFDGDGQPDYAVGAPNGNHYNSSRAGFARLYDSSATAVPGFLRNWKAAWAPSEAAGLVQLTFAFANPADRVVRLDIERHVTGPGGAPRSSERVWSGPAAYAAAGTPGVLATDGTGFTFLDPGPSGGVAGDDRFDYTLTIEDDRGDTMVLTALAGPGGAPPVAGEPALALDPAWPNPANPAVTVRFRASPREAVSLRILDVRGRLVRELFRGPGTGDWQHEVWNGRDNGGVAAASGLYLIQLEDGRRSLTRRVVLAR
jgi:hypothetical protein